MKNDPSGDMPEEKTASDETGGNHAQEETPLRTGPSDIRLEMSQRKKPLEAGDGRRMVVLGFEEAEMLPPIHLGNFSEEFISSSMFEAGVKHTARETWLRRRHSATMLHAHAGVRRNPI